MIKGIRRLLEEKPKRAESRARITIPEGRASNIFAIGDVHGNLDLLRDAEERIFRRMRDRTSPVLVICVGDLIDRGPDSSGVLDHVIARMRPPFYRLAVCGNHEDSFLNFIKRDVLDLSWLKMGGDATLLSYGIDARYALSLDPKGKRLQQLVKEQVPHAHIEFLERMPVCFHIGKYLFVHAGIMPGVPIADQTDHTMMWIREPFLGEGPKQDITVIHGHTQTKTIDFGLNRIGIDTGACVTKNLAVLHISAHGVEAI